MRGSLSANEKLALDTIQANIERAPETRKLADLLWALAEAQGDRKKHEDLGLIAATVQTWAERAYNVGGPEILVVLEAALKAQGVKL